MAGSATGYYNPRVVSCDDGLLKVKDPDGKLVVYNTKWQACSERPRLDTTLTAEEIESLTVAAEAFAAGRLSKADHPMTAVLIRKGVPRTSGAYVPITDWGVDVLRARGYAGPLPVSRAKSTA